MRKVTVDRNVRVVRSDWRGTRLVRLFAVRTRDASSRKTCEMRADDLAPSCDVE